MTTQGFENKQLDTFLDMTDPSKRPKIAEGMRPIEESLKVDPTAIARASDVVKDVADTAKGSGPEMKMLQARKDAFQRLRVKHNWSGEFKDSNDNPLYRGAISDEVQREIFERAKKVGVDTSRYGSIQDNFMANAARKYLGIGQNFGILGGNPADQVAYSLTAKNTPAVEMIV
jgi:hypothetical protein